MRPVLITKRRHTGIGLTALIDVVFILLLFFMLTSSFQPFQALDLKSALSASAHAKREPVLLMVDSEGQLRLADNFIQVLSDEQLQASVHTDASLVLLPHADTSVQFIVSALERLKSLGLTATLGNSITSEAAANP